LLRGRIGWLLEKLKGQPRNIAEVYALLPEFYGLKPCSWADPAGRAEELLKRLGEMERKKPSKQVTEWITLQGGKPEPEEFKRLVKLLRELLTDSLARYKMENDDLEAARKLFETSAGIAIKLEEWENYLACSSRSVRCSVLGAGSLEELRGKARAFEDLWSEAKKHETLTINYFIKESRALAEYLLFLAIEGRVGEVSELLKREGELLELLPGSRVALRLLLKLLGVRVGKPEARDVETALRNDIYTELRPIFLMHFLVLYVATEKLPPFHKISRVSGLCNGGVALG
jgi:hypothetical protein